MSGSLLVTHGVDPNQLGHRSGGHGHGGGDSQASGRGAGGPASKRITVGYGFWLFLLSDIVLFSAFFAAYAVLQVGTDGGPTPAIFDVRNTQMETGCLLASSFACGMASLAISVRRLWIFQVTMAATFAFGAIFLLLEGIEFVSLVRDGAGPGRSAFLSAFFSLVGCHGLHVTIGLMWLLTTMAQVFAKGFRGDVMRRFMCFALFWHMLDIVWIAVFTVVYLLGTVA